MSILAIISAQRWSQMTIRWQITLILMTLPPPPPPNAYPHEKNMYFLLFFFLIGTCLMINLITKIDTNRKY